MTILEDASSSSTAPKDTGNMISSVADRYITPEYLAPLPTSDKTGKSPLQLLAQTCSQIGADVGSNKLLQDKASSAAAIHNNNNNTDNNKSNKKSPALVVSDGGRASSSASSSSSSSRTPPSTIVASKPFSFKPYEPDNVGKKLPAASPRAGSVVSLSPGASSSSPRPRKSPAGEEKPSATSSTTTTATTSSSSETSPVIRSGLEVLAGHSAAANKDAAASLAAYRHLAAAGAAAGLDPTNPAFRPPFGLGGYPHASSLAASLASLGGGGVCRDPFCRDPTCPTAVYNAQAQLASSLSGAGSYADLLKAHQMAAAVAAAQSGANGLTPPNGLAGPGGPYICNWMNGRDGYCGKRHSSAEELLQHLRTHTNLSTSDSAAAAAAAAQAAASSSMLSSLYPPGFFGSSAASLNSAAALASLHRAYGGAMASSLSAASSRYHPYAAAAAAAAAGKSGNGLAGLAGLAPPPPGLGSLPPSLAALGYSPSSLYALYGSRLAGSSSVLP